MLQFSKSLATLSAVLLCLGMTACSNSSSSHTGINAHATALVNFSSTPQTVQDTSAVISMNYPVLQSPNIPETCLADPTAPQFAPVGWEAGTSTAPGYCYFGDLHFPALYNWEVMSGFCKTDHTGQTQIQDGTFSDSCSQSAANLAPIDSHFAIVGGVPSSLTVSTTGILTTNGSPKLRFYNSKMNYVGSSTATFVAADGSSATFPFPLSTSGTALPSDFYAAEIANMGPSNSIHPIDGSYFSLGGVTTMTAPIGVDAADIHKLTTIGENGRKVSETFSTTPYPIVSLYSSGQVSYKGRIFNVGSQPIAIKLYGSSSTSTTTTSGTTTTKVTTTQPTNAIVANSGSNTASILDVIAGTVVANIPVGTTPVSLIVIGGTKAYIANYGSNSVSEVDLGTRTVTHTISVGSHPQTVTPDPSGTAIWVGGLGYISKIDLTSYAVTYTQQINGSVNSLATSNAQNELVYTIVSNPAASYGAAGQAIQFGTATQTTNEFPLSTLNSSGSYGTMSAASYSNSNLGGTLADPGLQPSGTQVSAQWANGMGASATPTGFVVYDLVAHNQLMAGTTSTPVRGIASDAAGYVVYLTVPDSNQLITVPLPHF